MVTQLYSFGSSQLLLAKSLHGNNQDLEFAAQNVMLSTSNCGGILNCAL